MGVRKKLVGGSIILLQVILFVICSESSQTVSFPGVLRLERSIPNNKNVGLRHLRERDRVRHKRMLLSNSSSSSSPPPSSVGVVDFPVGGTYDPYLVGLYYTIVRLGSPAKDYYVQIDTGSDVLWVGCASCSGCPTSSGLHISLELYDPGSSSTSSVISCSDQICSLGTQSSDSVCSSTNNECSYSFAYGDGSNTSGYYVSDLLHFDTIVGGSVNTNSSASVAFGCSTTVNGDLTKSERAVDGIFGFGQQAMSVVSQLASKGVSPNAFSHCLKGDDAGGGILVLGKIIEPNIVYTPLVQSQPHYNLNLQSISVNGQKLSIDSSVFATSSSGGTIVDSGTTLAYLAEGAYSPFVNAISSYVSQNAQSVVSSGSQCYTTASSVSDIFPQVSLNFSGGASMILNPEDYLVEQNAAGGFSEWCIGFQENQGQSILGDLVLKDKIVVYDIASQQLGWASYDCSTAVNVSTNTSTGRTENVNAGELSNSSSQQNSPYILIPLTMIAFFLHIHVLLDKLFL